MEGLIGAFLAGLEMNRLIPKPGPLMAQIEFFGGERAESVHTNIWTSAEAA
jgi:hypothetical protein